MRFVRGHNNYERNRSEKQRRLVSEGRKNQVGELNGGWKGPPVERFLSFVGNADAAIGCRPWQGRVDKGGYGVFWINSRKGLAVIAHRFAYELEMGEIPKDHELHHECRNKTCVNPAHLRPMTKREHGLFHNPKKNAPQGTEAP